MLLPTVKEIRENVSKNIIYEDSYNDKIKYENWKKTGKISDEDKEKIISNLRNRIRLLKSKITTLKKETGLLENELKTTISDSVALQEQSMFLAERKVK